MFLRGWLPGPEIVIHAAPTPTSLIPTLNPRPLMLQLRLEEARSVAGELPKAARLLLLPAVGVDMYLDALLAKDCNLLDPALMGGRPYTPLAYQLRLKWAVLRGAY